MLNDKEATRPRPLLLTPKDGTSEAQIRVDAGDDDTTTTRPRSQVELDDKELAGTRPEEPMAKEAEDFGVAEEKRDEAGDESTARAD